MDTHVRVPLTENEYADLKAIAGRRGQSFDEWARQALLRAKNEQAHTVQSKLRGIAKAAKHSFPSGDIEDMLAEIEAGLKPL